MEIVLFCTITYLLLIMILIARWQGDLWRAWVSKAYVRFCQKTPSQDTTCRLVEGALKALCVKPKIEKEKGKLTFEFNYQNGNFVLEYSETSPEVLRILYPGISTLPLAYIDPVRTLCNQINQMDGPINAFYAVSDHREVVTHLKCHVKNDWNQKFLQEMLSKVFNEIFYVHRFAAQIIDEMKEKEDAEKVNDFEYGYHQSKSMENVLYEGQVEHDCYPLQHSGHLDYGSPQDMTLDEWLEIVELLQCREIRQMECYRNGNVVKVEGNEAARDFVLVHAVKGHDDTDQPAPSATLRIEYEPIYTLENDGSAAPHVLTVVLQLELTTADAYYYRISYMLPEVDSTRSVHASRSDASASPTAASMLYAVDRRSQQQAQAEYKYMWHDASDKVREHHEDELTSEQITLLRLTEPDAGFYLYWGSRYLSEERHLEAFIMLQKVWNVLNPKFPNQLDKRSRLLFLDVNYWMGCCLYQLGLFQKALYYLKFSELKADPYYFIMIIRCMTAMHDSRAYDYVKQRKEEAESYIAQCEESLEEEVPQKMYTYLTFLRKREVNLLIERGEVEKAEKICTKMLKEESLMAFAFKKLHTIQELHKAQGEDTTQTDTPTDTSHEGTPPPPVSPQE